MADEVEPYFFGWDTVIFTAASAVRVCAAMIEAQKTRWPNLILHLEWGKPFEFQTKGAPPAACYAKLKSERRAVVYFFRDAAMQQFFQEEAWLLDATGEGPFTVYFSRRMDIDFELAGVREPIGINQIGRETSPARLVAPEILEVTLVSPGDPAEEPFCKEVFERLRRCCR